MELPTHLQSFGALFCTLTKEFSEKRAEYWRQEKLRESSVNLDSFSEEEKSIYRAHREAINKGHFTYQDPVTKDKIWTTYSHFLKGKCCGEACRHCIYNYESVPDSMKNDKVFNGSFWVNLRQDKTSFSYFKDLLKIIKIKPKIK